MLEQCMAWPDIYYHTRFPLKDIQEEELRRWVAGSWDTKWLVRTAPRCVVT